MEYLLENFWDFWSIVEGVDVDPTKAIAIATMKPPAKVKEMKSFLGKVSYIRRFIPGLASITLAFTKLLKKGKGFEWGDAKSFQKLQQIMMNLLTVQASVLKKPLLLYLTSSSSAIGALIAQEDGGDNE